jgi:alpha-L-rhamnosidase
LRRSALLICVLSTLSLAVSSTAKPVQLRCESLLNPIGIDAPKPALSWQSDNTERNWIQSAYQILVSSSPDALKSGAGNIWDSGRQASGESVGIPYGGPPVEARKRYYWTVRVWDAHGKMSEAPEPAFWEMGLLQRANWNAKWIRWENPQEAEDENSMKWIWLQGQDSTQVQPNTVAIFRYEFELSQMPEEAALFLMARGSWKATVNGRDAGSKTSWNQFDRREIRSLLVTGRNTVDIAVTVTPAAQYGPDAGAPGSPRLAALAALIKLTGTAGDVVRYPTGDKWQARLESDAAFHPAAAVAPFSDSRYLRSSGFLPQPAAQFRKQFSVSKTVAKARLYITALGAYRAFLNGKPVSNDVLTPGFTAFPKRVQYQTYDVTNALTNGPNTVAALLGDGWFASPLSWNGVHFSLAPVTRFIAQLEIEYSDGTSDTVGTDQTWKASPSPILHAEIYAGETYDARLEQKGWTSSGFDDNSWQPAVFADDYTGLISSQIDVPPQVVSTLKPEKVSAGPDGAYIYDMGQNMVGWAALKVSGPAGTTVRLRFAEILNPGGGIYTKNLRNADATDYYTLRGGGEETYQPSFTFHGFRYVEVTGYPGTPDLSSITGEVVSSLSGDPAATLTTSSELVNRMWRIGIWGQRGNFLSIPTDCPQRDERLGWMGDAGVFWRTGSYNFNIAAFTGKFMRDVDDAQLADGDFTNVSPDIGLGDNVDGAPGWADAGVIVPWTTWLQYGDRRVISRNWDSMEKYMKFIEDANPNYLRTQKLGPNFADWLAPDQNTDKNLIATAYWALSAGQMSQMAHAIGNEEASRRYTELYGRIRDAFQRVYVREDGLVGTGTQASYVLALYVHLLPTALEPAVTARLVHEIDVRNGHLSTGFLATPFLLFVLADHGRADIAYKLLLTETYPSWGYMLSKGATTWWERWNSDTGDPAMNSFNHYSFGSVVAWVYRSVVGIDTSITGPGFHQIVIAPKVTPAINEAAGEYQSAYGTVKTSWKGTPDGPWTLDITIPANTSARVILPNSKEEKVGSGTYNFRVSANQMK